jgi:hypothetical protein
MNQMISQSLANFSVESLQTMLEDAGSLLRPKEDKVSHRIVLIRPGVQRHEVVVGLVCPNMLALITNRLHGAWHEIARNLYRLFIRVPQAKSQASVILKAALHRVLPLGGEWPIQRLEKLSTNAWQTSAVAASDQPRLRIGPKPISLQIVFATSPSVSAVGPLETYEYEPQEHISLEDRYFVPRVSSEATFDSFIYSSTAHTITVFHVAVSESHTVKVAGFKWLQQLRSIRRTDAPLIQYIAVTANLPVSLQGQSQSGQILGDKVYHLLLTDIPAITNSMISMIIDIDSVLD